MSAPVIDLSDVRAVEGFVGPEGCAGAKITLQDYTERTIFGSYAHALIDQWAYHRRCGWAQRVIQDIVNKVWR